MNILILPAFSGLIDSIISSVLRIILTPIMELVAWLLETILGPILETILVPVMEFAVDLVMRTMSSVFYAMLKALLTLVDTIEKSFQIFAGVAPVKYNGVETDLLNVFVTQNTELSRAFWLLTFLCLLLCGIFTIYGVTRSTFDFDFENKRPVGKVLGAAGKTCLTFLLIPLFVVFTIQLTSVVMKEVYRVTNIANLSVADTVFQISAMTANKDPNAALSQSQTFTEGVRKQFNDGGWKNAEAVKAVFDLAKMDYVLGFGLAIFMIFIMATISFVFVQRLFEIMLLYLAAPFFVSTMPLDDGQKYNGWRDMFIAKMIAGMGTLVMMNLYLMAVTVIMGADIVLDTRTLSASGVMGSEYITYDYLVKIVFVAGGALAVKHGSTLITGLVNYQAGIQEQTMIAQTGAMVRRAGGFVAGAAYGIAKTTAKVGFAPAKLGVWGAKTGGGYALANKRINGDDSSKMTRALRTGYDAKQSVKDVAGKAGAIAHGDFGGAFKKDGEDTYASKRVTAFQNRDFTSFFKLKDDKLKEEREAPIRKARAEEDEKNRAFVTSMRERAEQGEKPQLASSDPGTEAFTGPSAGGSFHASLDDGTYTAGSDGMLSFESNDSMDRLGLGTAQASETAAESPKPASAAGETAFTGRMPRGATAIQDASIPDDDDGPAFRGGGSTPPPPATPPTSGSGGSGTPPTQPTSGKGGGSTPPPASRSSGAYGKSSPPPVSSKPGSGGSGTPPTQPTPGKGGGSAPPPASQSSGAQGKSSPPPATSKPERGGGNTPPRPRPPSGRGGGNQHFN